ncbi:MAG: XRE family transcriptional regulator [Ruminococcaceae bacterium]|nr:XRE family transcriptional regulator [Oscillospiraceae bacterium]
MDHQEITKAFGANLKQLRKDAGLTQVELAERLGYSSKAVSKWESGECIAPAVLLPTIAKILHTDVNSLLRHSDEIAYFLGVDGGGTKTEFLLAKANGEIIRQTILSGCNPNDVGLSACFEVLKQGITELCRDIPHDQISLFAGFAGCGTGPNRQKTLQFLSTFGFRQMDCNSDTYNAMAATLGDRNGIIVIAGTGSITFVQKNGEKHRRGGFNYLFEEGGSGYTVGRDAFHFALKAEERGNTDSLLYRLVLKQCETERAVDHLAEIYTGGKKKVASFAPLVFEAAKAGDPHALEILERNAAVLAQEIEDGAEVLGEENPEVILIGGLCKQEDLLLPMIKKYLTINCRLRTHTSSLAKGALYLAGWKENTSC